MERKFKGKSIICFPEDYFVIDIETTGLDYDFCNIIEIAAIKYSAGKKCGVFSSLVKPPLERTFFPLRNNGEGEWVERYVDEYITDLTGITNEMLESAPLPEAVLPKFLDFIGDAILVGHNVNFDINFLYDAILSVCKRPLTNNFVDTLRIARKCFPNLSHHRLSDIAQECEIAIDAAHRAEADCTTTEACFRVMKESVLKSMTEGDFVKLFSKKHKVYAESLSGIAPTVDEFDETNPLFGKVVVFTGALSSMGRRDAFQLVANLGGNPEDSITKKTNYLVIGSSEFAKSVKDGKSSKMMKAESYRQKGQDIIILSEKAFFQMISDWNDE